VRIDRDEAGSGPLAPPPPPMLLLLVAVRVRGTEAPSMPPEAEDRIAFVGDLSVDRERETNKQKIRNKQINATKQARATVGRTCT
jgi:hypothetical protein